VSPACPGTCARVRPMLRVADVVRLLRLSQSSVWRALRRGEFPGARRILGHMRIPAADVAAWVEREHRRGDTPGPGGTTQKRRRR
jgi:predicted DNA-binding transcriptional regulator AlpA